MSEKSNHPSEVLQQAARIVTNDPVTFELDILPQNSLQAWLQKKGWSPAKKKYQIRPIVLGNLIRISRLLLTINPDILKQGKSLLDVAYQMVSDHGVTVAQILAIAVQNNQQEPNPKLVREINQNMTAKEMITLLALVLQQMDLTSFISSIISIRGLNVLDGNEKPNPENEVSPLTQGSSIAPGKPSAE